MTVTKEITRLEKSSVKLNIKIGKDDVRSEYDSLIKEYTKTMQLPGFRKGKVPREVLERKYSDLLKDEAVHKIIDKSLNQVLDGDDLPKESRPLPYCQPAVQDEPKLDFENDLQFSVVYDVFPDVKVEKWEGFEAEIPDASIEEEDIARELEVFQERNSVVIDKPEGEAAEKGDVLTVNYCELDDSGGTVAGSARDDFTFTLGAGYNLYQFDDEIAGMKKGETKEFSKAFPEDFANKDLAGKTKKLKTVLTALKVKKLPDLDDDLAQDVDEKFKTLEDLKNDIRSRLNRDLENRMRGIKVNKILEKIMENTPVEIPETMLTMELDSRWQNMARRFNTDGDGLFKIMGNSEDQAKAIFEEWKPDAAKAIHRRLIVENLMRELKIEASDEEAEKEIEKIAETGRTPVEEVREFYEKEGMKEYLKQGIRENKIFDIFIEKNQLKAGAKEKYIDLIEKNG